MFRDISIIIVSYNTVGLLRNCLVSLRNSEAAGSEIIVVDNASGDGSAEMVQAEFPAVRLIKNGENLGFARGSNQGIREARGKYILMLNSDTVTHQGAVRAMTEFLESNADAGAVTCKLLNEDGSIQATISDRPGPVLLLFRLLSMSQLVTRDRHRRFLGSFGFVLGRTIRGYLAPYCAGIEPFEVENASGACLMVRHAVLDSLGLLDERFFMYFEDMDLCRRIRGAGWKLYYLPQVEITHLVGKSSGNRMRRYGIHSHRALFAFYQKHFSQTICFIVRCMVFTTSTFRWIWNCALGALLRDSGYRRNAQDLKELIRICF
ncbi:MAG TPA: glycosyltransferase family 2 protein [Candidatus Angelobacter sp.]|nr:glycosyltransferase family 2 protein [Candidatus Angelobacter sp.]